MAQATIGSREMIERLIRFDTTSRESNLPLIDFVRDYLDGYGIKSDLVFDDERNKANLYATIGPEDIGGVVLSGHTDVVPVDGQAWDSDPFTLAERDEMLFGRGTCDMKGFIAIALARVPEFLEQKLTSPVHFAFSFDEEVGCLGVRPLIEHIVENLPKPKIVIVGEPTNMTVVNAHKSGYSFMTEVTGLEAHSSVTHLGVNSIMAASELIGELGRVGSEMMERVDQSGRFDPPYTTVHVGTIEGGTALNIVPRCCSFHWEYRGLPDQDDDEIPARFNGFAESTVLPKMQAVSDEARIETACVNAVPGLVPQDGSPAEALALRLAQQNDTFAVSYGTEAGLFQEAGMPAVICGPGDILQAHKPNEFVTLEQVDRCEQFMRRLVKHLV